jgi:hypothetical protein
VHLAAGQWGYGSDLKPNHTILSSAEISLACLGPGVGGPGHGEIRDEQAARYCRHIKSVPALNAGLDRTSNYVICEAGMILIAWYPGAQLRQGARITHPGKLENINRLRIMQVPQNRHCSGFIRCHLAAQKVRDGNAGDDQNDRHHDQQLD